MIRMKIRMIMNDNDHNQNDDFICFLKTITIRTVFITVFITIQRKGSVYAWHAC
jgi:hypothetical protein